MYKYRNFVTFFLPLLASNGKSLIFATGIDCVDPLKKKLHRETNYGRKLSIGIIKIIFLKEKWIYLVFRITFIICILLSGCTINFDLQAQLLNAESTLEQAQLDSLKILPVMRGDSV